MADDENFNRVLAGLKEVAEIEAGHAAPARVFVPAQINVKEVRQRVGLSQQAFAAKFGFSAASVRQWEQGRRKPEASARVLLTVIDREPAAVVRALEPSNYSRDLEEAVIDKPRSPPKAKAAVLPVIRPQAKAHTNRLKGAWKAP